MSSTETSSIDRKNILTKSTETLYYKRDFDKHRFIEKESSKADYVTENDRFAFPFCRDMQKSELPIYEGDWEVIQEFCDKVDTETETAQLKIKQSFLVLDSNSLNSLWCTTEVTHVQKRKSGFKLQELNLLFSKERQKTSRILYLEK